MKNVLIINNDLKVTEEICNHLSLYMTYTAATGQKALDMARDTKPDLILLYPFLPDMDGFSVLDQLQYHPQLKSIPVILLTYDDSPSFQTRGLKSGVVDFILMESNRPLNQIMDWEILKYRIDMHLQFGEYRTSLEHSVEELENSIGLSFAELIECKDYNFSGHIIRTERYTEYLALALYKEGTFPAFLSLGAIEDITKAVPFHDIGKIGISDEILCKQGPLDAEELKIARSHTTIGAKILDDIYNKIPSKSYFKTAGIIARSHHERYDGKGYPDGISGENIPLSCRIVSVANVYDACTNDRIYHRAMSHEDACREIEKGIGSEFDPKIAEIFLERKNEIAFLKEELTALSDSLGKLPFVYSPVPAEISF